jgi:hypothetical protein
MSTTTHSEVKLSYQRTFDDICKEPRRPLLFRLHHHDSCATHFNEKLKLLVASSYENDENVFSRVIEAFRIREDSESFMQRSEVVSIPGICICSAIK